MPAQARANVDMALVPADAHGCTACPHTCTGPGVSGSPDVFVNGQPAMRVGDPGVHAACCGPNKWVSAQGSSTVFFNDIPASRLGDMTAHCGGVGAFISGSDNVYVGG